MLRTKRILAIIPARGGSKGLPGKNIKPLMGKPLIGWTISQAMKCELIDRIYVSTDSREIANVSQDFGLPVERLRPAHLALDNSTSVDVVLDAINYFGERREEFDYALLLEPTSPMRKKDDLANMIKLAIDNPSASGVISVGQVHMEHPLITKKLSSEGFIEPYIASDSLILRRQDEDVAYFPYGVGYLIKIEDFLISKQIYLRKMLPYVIERWQNYEIDDIYDFLCIEKLFKYKEMELL